MDIKLLRSIEVYSNRWLRIREDRIERSDGTEGIYTVVDKPDCALIIPLQDDKLCMVRQFRYALQETTLEFPQGSLEAADSSPEEIARVELRQEAGLLAGRLTRLGCLRVAQGFVNQKQHVYLAEDLIEQQLEPEPEELGMLTEWLAVKTFDEMVFDGLIQDSSSLAAWAQFRIWLSVRQGQRTPARS